MVCSRDSLGVISRWRVCASACRGVCLCKCVPRLLRCMVRATACIRRREGGANSTVIELPEEMKGNSNVAYAFRPSQFPELNKHLQMKQTKPADTQTLRRIFGNKIGWRMESQ